MSQAVVDGARRRCSPNTPDAVASATGRRDAPIGIEWATSITPFDDRADGRRRSLVGVLNLSSIVAFIRAPAGGVMRVFVSWSGERSRAVATALQSFLERVHESLRPWVSHRDIAAGGRWREELSTSLESASSAVVCLSPRSLRSPWVQFETGALASSKICARICPYLIDLKPDDLRGQPLSDFQTREANEEGTFDLLVALNATLDKPLRRAWLRNRFERAWPELEASIRAAPAEPAALDYNNLDELGLRKLLSIHFLASQKRLADALEESLGEFNGELGAVNLELLEIRLKRAISEGRDLLSPFHSDSTGPLLEFLDKCLPPAELGHRLERGLRILAREQPERRKRAASELIREEQAALTQTINERLAKVSRRIAGAQGSASTAGGRE